MLGLAIFGLLAFSAGAIGLVIYSFKQHRTRWQRFADKHGLAVTGLGTGETPYMEGQFAGVSVNLEMAVLHRYGKHKLGNVSTTRAVAMFSNPLPAGLFISAKRRGDNGIATGRPEIDAALDLEGQDPEAVRALFSNALFSQWALAFIGRHSKLGFISEHGVSTAMVNMVSDFDKLEHLLQECASAVVGIEGR